VHAHFDHFAFDSEKRQLLREGVVVHLSPKVFSLLETLIAASPRALSKEQLHETIWPKTFVEESGLPGLIAELRSALQDDSKNPRFIRTVHRFGYAFCGELKTPITRVQVALVVFRGTESPLFEGVNVLGRDPDADICIDDHTVSRRHASIVIAGEGASVEDLKSKNGTLLDEKKVEGGVPLLDGQTIVLGDARVLFKRRRALSSTVTSNGL